MSLKTGSTVILYEPNAFCGLVILLPVTNYHHPTRISPFAFPSKTLDTCRENTRKRLVKKSAGFMCNGNLRGRKSRKSHMFAAITDEITQSVSFQLAYFFIAFCLLWHKNVLSSYGVTEEDMPKNTRFTDLKYFLL
jgi:hypothetical protein